MKNIFSDLDSLVNQNGINKKLLKRYLVPSTINRLSAKLGEDLGAKFLAKTNSEHDYVPQFNIHQSTHTALVNTDTSSLELEILEPGHTEKIFVSNNNCHQTIGVLKGKAKLNIFTTPSPQKNQVNLLSIEYIDNGDIVTLNNKYFTVNNCSDESLFLLYVTDKKTLSKDKSVRAYKIQSGAFSHFVSSKLSSARLETMISIVGEMEYNCCSTLVKKLSKEHQDYLVRWESIKTYLKLNPNDAVNFLTDVLATEAHPHVINAARESLELITRSSICEH